MKNRMMHWVLLVGCVCLVMCSSIVYVKLQQWQAQVYESRAIIAMAQPAIIEAQGRRAIDSATANQLNAIAMQVRVNTALLVVFAVFPYVMALVYVAYKGGVEIAQIKQCNAVSSTVNAQE